MTKNPPVPRTNFNWPEEFRGIVSGYPVSAQCNHYGCDKPPEYHVGYHGCLQELLCDAHLATYINLVNDRLMQFGSVSCVTCDRRFPSVRHMIQFRPV